MVEQPAKEQFLTDTAAKLTLPDALGRARLAIGQISSAPVDSIRSCQRSSNGEWVAIVEVVEVPARMGDNDLLSAYELVLDPRGELTSFRRTERYHREDGAAS